METVTKFVSCMTKGTYTKEYPPWKQSQVCKGNISQGIVSIETVTKFYSCMTKGKCHKELTPWKQYSNLLVL